MNTKFSFRAKYTDMIVDIDRELNCITFHNLFSVDRPLCVPTMEDEKTTIEAIINDFSKLINETNPFLQGFVLGSGYDGSFICTIWRADIAEMNVSPPYYAIFMSYEYDAAPLNVLKKKVYKSNYYDINYILHIIKDLKYIIYSIKDYDRYTEEQCYITGPGMYEIKRPENYPISINLSDEFDKLLQSIDNSLEVNARDRRINEIIDILKARKDQLSDTVIDLIKELLEGHN